MINQKSMRLRIYAILLALAALARGSFAVGQSAPSGPPNILLVTIDTLRADRVGAYGHAGARTPAMDRLAREGVLVSDAVVHVPQTRPSHASIFTGRLPYEHGLRDNASPPLKPGTPTLASMLKARRYETAAFIAAYPVSRSSGLYQGFDIYDDPFEGGARATSRNAAMERRAARVVDSALGWLQKPRRTPFFAWLHFFDPHAPYEPPANFVNKANPYDGEVAYADAQLARVLTWLDQTGLRRQTLVVVTSDHGEGLGDHGEEEHLFFVYDSTLRVPLLLSWPGRLPQGVRVTGQFRSVDLLPTILELAGVPASPSSGLSHAAQLRSDGRLPDNESYAESLYGQLHFGYAPLRALRAEGWKYIDAPRAELYRVTHDPAETKNLLEPRAQLAIGLKRRLATYDRDQGQAPTAEVSRDAAALERLASLGYVGGGFFHGGTPSGADPKDKIAEFQEEKKYTSTAIRLYNEGDYTAAIRLLRQLTRPRRRADGAVVEPRSFNVDYYLGRSLLAIGSPREAIEPLERAVRLLPTAAHVYAYIAEAHRASGNPTAAMEAADRGLATRRDNPELLGMKGRLLLQKGDLGGAQPLLEQARALDPGDARFHVDLANLHRSRGQVQQALTEAREAVRLNARSPEAQVSLGLSLGASGLEKEAAEAFRAALRLRPDHPDALFYLGSIELRAGRPAAAKPHFERLVQKAPAYPGAREALAAAVAGVAASVSALPPGALRLRLIRTRELTRIQEATRRLSKGEDFAEVARALSEDASAVRGGDIGFLHPDDLAPALREAAKTLSKGAVSAVVETANGFVLLKRES